MALAQNRVSAILFLLILASSQAAEPDVPNRSLEAAKQDLLALPNASQNSGNSRPNELRIDVPNLPSASGGAGEIAKPSTALLPSSAVEGKGDDPLAKTKAPSEGWLVDAFKTADAQARAQRAADEQHARDLQRVQGKNGTAAAVNPFSAYMGQWLSPHDPVLAQITGTSQWGATSSATKDSFEALTAKVPGGASTASNGTGASVSDASTFPGGSTGMQNPAAGGVILNPYLPPDAASAGSINSLSSPSAFQNKGKSGGANVNSGSTLSGSGNGSAGARKPKLAEPAYAPPTAPLIDERKYFPQLHRF